MRNERRAGWVRVGFGTNEWVRTCRELEEAESESERAKPQPDPQGAYPALINLAPLLAQADALGGTTQDSTAQTSILAGRIAALNGRATALRGPIIDSATRARMLAGI